MSARKPGQYQLIKANWPDNQWLGFVESMIKFVIVLFFLFIATVGVAEKSPNPPIAHDADAGKEETKTGDTQKEQEAKPPPQAPLITIPLVSPTVTVEIKQENTTESANKSKDVTQDSKDEWMWPPSPAWAAVIVAGVSAFATVIYAIISFFQWCAIRRQADIAETSLRKIGRAYLQVIGWQLTGSTIGKDTVATCFYINPGQRPAKIKRCYTSHCVSEKLPAIPDYTNEVPTYDGEPINLYPRIQDELSRDINNIDPADYDAIWSKEKRLYFCGCIIFDDIIDGEHKMTFFAWYDIDNKQFSQVYDKDYNTSD